MENGLRRQVRVDAEEKNVAREEAEAGTEERASKSLSVRQKGARMRPTRLIVAALLAASLPAVAHGEEPNPEIPAFRLSDTGTNGVEVNLGITSKGAIFFGGWDRIGRSMDDGTTWDALVPGPLGQVYAGDRVLIVDRQTDRVYVDDLLGNCTNLSWSDDLGETWTENPAAACVGSLVDHQKVAVGDFTTLPDPTGSYPNVVYVCSNALSHSQCSASPDGGLTWGPSVPFAVGCGFQGVPMAAPDGALYQPRACGSDEVVLDISEDNGLTWETSTVFAGPGASIGSVPDVDFTPDGAAYYVWTRGDWLPYLTRSTDRGRMWKPPIPFGPPDLRSALFPVVAAGGNGRIGVAFYGTTDSPAGWDGNPGNAPDGVRWHLYAGTITNADTDEPKVRVVQVTEQPVQIGCVAKFLGCIPANIAEYIDAEVAPDGKLVVGYVDGCPAGCTSRAESMASDGWVAVQTAGLSLAGP